MNVSGRVRDSIIYIGISLLLVVFVVAYAEFAPKGSEFPVQWVWLFVITLIVFGYAAKALRRLWRQTKFWFTYAALLGLHLLAFWALISRMQSHFLLLTSVVAGPEVIAVCLCIELICGGH